MAELARINKLSVEISGEELFSMENIRIDSREVIGIVGRNGSGKSTLLKIVSRETNQTDQHIVEKIDWLISPQDISIVEQEVLTFDLANTREDISFQELSGGEKLKKRLLQGFSEKKALLLLDEPTNHLDQESLQHLITWIKKYQGTIIVVSHDRYFLDQVATKIWSFEEGKVTAFKGNYSQFQKNRMEKRKRQEKEFQAQQKEVQALKKEMKRFADMSASAHAQSTKKEGYKEHYRAAAKRMDKQKKSAEKRLNKELGQKKINKVTQDKKIDIAISGQNTKSGPLYMGTNIGITLSKKVLFKSSHFTINYQDKVAISGKNGAGKTTLLKLLLGNISDYEGTFWRSKTASVAFLSQEVFDLPQEMNVEEFLNRKEIEETRIMMLFVQLGFSSSQLSQPISSLSMGERVKLKLLKEILAEKEVLILDEPTNHLDIPTREELEEVLLSYEGTVIFVSHDTYFKEKVKRRELVIENQQVIDKDQRVAPKEKSDKLVLEMKKDRLLSELSLYLPASKEYLAAEKEFNDVLKKWQEVSK